MGDNFWKKIPGDVCSQPAPNSGQASVHHPGVPGSMPHYHADILTFLSLSVPTSGPSVPLSPCPGCSWAPQWQPSVFHDHWVDSVTVYNTTRTFTFLTEVIMQPFSERGGSWGIGKLTELGVHTQPLACNPYLHHCILHKVEPSYCKPGTTILSSAILWNLNQVFVTISWHRLLKILVIIQVRNVFLYASGWTDCWQPPQDGGWSREKPRQDRELGLSDPTSTSQERRRAEVSVG
jgi:hypothetical protein